MPFPINDYASIGRLNRLYEKLQEIEGTPLYDELTEIQRNWFSDIDELVEHSDDIIHYADCDSMSEVAQHYIEETGALSALPENLRYYFDYQALGRDMEIEGNYLVTSHGIFEYSN